MPSTLTLDDALENYDALAAGVPLHQWQEDSGKACAACQCQYQQVIEAEAIAKKKDPNGTLSPERRKKIKPCTHDRAPKPLFLRPLVDRTSDNLEVYRLKADVDRFIEALPRMARRIFNLRYRQYIPDGHGGRRQRTLQEVHAIMGGPWTELRDYHDMHLARMKRVLRTWFPAGWSRRIA